MECAHRWVDLPDTGENPFVKIEGKILSIFKHYAWDGASGPTWDDKTNMRASLVHDALYQLMRENLLDRKHRKYADQLLRSMMIDDGMALLRKRAAEKRKAKNLKLIKKNKQPDKRPVRVPHWEIALLKTRAWYYYRAVRIFGAHTCKPEKNPRGQIITI